MGKLEGYRGLILALAQIGVGLYLLSTGERETGLAFVASGFASIAVRDVTNSPPAWRQPRPRARRKPVPRDVVIGEEERIE